MLAAPFRIILCSLGWAGLFLACRLAVWLAGRPGWWCVPAALAVGGAVILARRIGRADFEKTREKELAAPADPRLPLRMKMAWKRGQPFRKGRVFPPTAEPPWYLCLPLSAGLTGQLVELGDGAGDDTGDFGDVFTWRRGPNAAWVDFPAGVVDDDCWRAFAAMLGTLPQFRPPAGVVVRADAQRLLANPHASIHEDAFLLRRRLESLQNACRRRLPLYLVVDNLDRLYGLRSLISLLPPERRADPVGALRPKGRAAAEFVRDALEKCLAELDAASFNPEAGPAAFQAPEEIRRLADPLAAVVGQLCKNGKGPLARGLFLAAAAPGGPGVEPLMAKLATFQPVDETLPVQPWFLRRLLRVTIPNDADASRRAAGGRFRLAYPAGAAGLLLGSAGLCLLMTCSFLESRGVLLSARGRAQSPESAETLPGYLELADSTRRRNSGWRLPRFGMTEPEKLENVLRRRYADSYFDLKAIPSIELVQDAALAAAASTDPGEIGNALLLLAVTRDGIGRNLPVDPKGRGGSGGSGGSDFLVALVETLGLATADDMRQLEAYFDWTGRQEWMPVTHAALIEFEKFLLDNAAGGDLSWLPEWINLLPCLHSVDGARVWDDGLPGGETPGPALVEPAWTIDGYRIAESLLRALVPDADADADDAGRWERKRDAALRRHRERALARWREAAAVLWDGFRSRVPDSKIAGLFRDAARGDDPAGRFLQLLEHHLLPMFDGADGAAHPDLHWLRLRVSLRPPEADPSGTFPGMGELAGRLAEAIREIGSDRDPGSLSRRILDADGRNGGVTGPVGQKWLDAIRRAGGAAENPDDNLEAVRAQFLSWNNPGRADLSGQRAALADAAEPAGRLHEYLRESAGGASWDSLSPLATLDYMRYLAARRAALKLDAVWRERVYQPAQLTPGGDMERLRRLTAPGGQLEKFLTGPASGFWRWDGRRIVNCEWNRLDFMFARDFLDFCADTLREGKTPGIESVDMPFAVDAVHVDAGAREHPVAVEFVFESGGVRQEVSFKNYRIREKFTWRLDSDARAEIRVVFPSLTASVQFDGDDGLSRFVGLFEGGAAVLGRDLFPSAAAALERMGISRVAIRATLENGADVGRLAAAAFAGIPETIITPGLAHEPAPAYSPAFGPLADLGR